MKNRTRILPARRLIVLLLVVILATIAPLPLHTDNAIFAQTTTSADLATPALAAEATARGVVLSWEAVPDAERYELMAWWDEGTGWRRIGGDNLTGTSYTHTTVTAGTKYHYTIRAVNAAGEKSAWLLGDYPSATALATAGAGTSTPTPTATAAAGAGTFTPTPTASVTAPSLLKLTAEATARGVVLRWETAPDAARYALMTWWDAGTGWQPIGGNNLTGTSYTHTTVTAGTKYHYTIRVVNAAGEKGAWLLGDYPSATALATQGAGTSTPTPTATAAPGAGTSTPTPTPTATVSGLSVPVLMARATEQGVVILSWEEVPQATRYELRAYWDVEIGWHPIGGKNVTGTTYTHSSVLGGTKYYYTIRAVNAAGATSAWLLEYPFVIALSATTGEEMSPSTPPSLPAPTAPGLPAPTLTAKVKGANAAELSWTPVAGAIGYTVATWSTGRPSWEGVSMLIGPTATSLLRGGLAAGKTYYFSVAALDSSDRRSAYSEPVPVTIPVVVPAAGSKERAALVALFEATDGNNWTHNDNWLTDAPVATWYGVFTDNNGHVSRLHLESNGLGGSIPDLSALTNLLGLNLNRNQLTGPIPYLGALTKMTKLQLAFNQLSGPIPDLSGLTSLRLLEFEKNQLSGPIPDLSSLTKLLTLILAENRLSGPFPDLSTLTRLDAIALADNQLSGPILNLNHLTNLTYLILRGNKFSGPVPDLSALTKLTSLDISSNPLCLPEGIDFSDWDPFVAVPVESLNLPTCTSAETMLTPAVPQNLTPTVGAGQVTLTWSAAANAVSYELRGWDSIDRRWEPFGGALSARTYRQTVLTDGRRYYFQVRARDANGVHSAWSQSVYVAVVPQHFPPPPQSLGVTPIYQKYVNVDGVHVVADNDVSDEQLVLLRQIITGMLSNRTDLHATMSLHGTTIFLQSTRSGGGLADRNNEPWKAFLPGEDPYCFVFIHELAHLVHFAIEEQPGGQAFNSRLEALYQAALNAGRWDERYAARNILEFWAETVRYWFWGSLSDPLERECQFSGGICTPLEQTYSKLADYEPEAAKLVEEVFGDATVPPACKP